MAHSLTQISASYETNDTRKNSRSEILNQRSDQNYGKTVQCKMIWISFYNLNFKKQATYGLMESSCNMISIGSEDQSIYSDLQKEPHRNFTQICSPDQYKKSDKCSICVNTFSQLLNSSKNCKFCGKCVCNDCSKRKRRNPQNDADSVRICDLCHFQILYKNIIESSMMQKQETDKQRNEINEECLKHKEELYKKQKINEEIKHQTQAQRIKYSQLLEEKKQKILDIEECQNKKMQDSSTFKERIQKLQQEIKQQEQQLTELRSENQNKNDLNDLLSEKEEDFVSVKSRYESIQKDIDKKKLQSQTFDGTDVFEDNTKQKSAKRYQRSIIDFNHITSSIGGNSNSSIHQSTKRKTKRDQLQKSSYCEQTKCNCF